MRRKEESILLTHAGPKIVQEKKEREGAPSQYANVREY